MKFDLIKCEIFGDESDIAILAREHDEESDGPGESVRIDVLDFDPYFYIPTSETGHARELMEDQIEDIKGQAREIAENSDGDLSVEEAENIIEEERDIVDIIDGFEEIDEEPVTKVIVDHPSTVPGLRDEFSRTWESDIPFEMRFRVDTGIQEVFEVPTMCLQEVDDNRYKTSWTLIEPCPDDEAVHDPRNFYFDIEVGGEEQKLPEDDDLNPISCITGFDSYSGQLISWVWRDDYDRDVEEQTYEYDSCEHTTVDPDEIADTFETVWKSHAENTSEWEDPDRLKEWVTERLDDVEQDVFEDIYAESIQEWDGDEFYSFLFAIEESLEELEFDEVSYSFDWEVRRFSGESDMIVNFFNYFREEDIDILSGWYSDKFDIPYIVQRCYELNVDPEIWSEFGYVDDGLPIGSWGQAKISGLFLNDLERRYDNLEGPSSTELESVAREEIGMEWEQEAGNIQELWDNAPQSMLRYNAHDVVATAQIDVVAGVTDFFLEKMYMTGTRVEEIEKDSNVITYYCMYEAGDDEIIPRGTSQTHKEFGGGRVLIPDRPGILDNIAVLDLSKIYPSIMISLNLSYETTCGVDPIHLREPLELRDKIPVNAWNNLEDDVTELGAVYDETTDHDTDYVLVDWELDSGDVISPLDLGKKGRKEIFDVLYDMESDGTLRKTQDWGFETPDIARGTQLPNGVRIDMQEEGIITRVLREMFELRYTFGDQMDSLDPGNPNYKQEYDRLYNRRQNMKDNINAVFGYMGYKKSPLFRPEIAMTVTFIGRNVLKMCEVVASEELGYEIIYGDSVTGDTTVPISTDGDTPQELTFDEVWNQFSDRYHQTSGYKDVLGVNRDLYTVSVTRTGIPQQDQINRVIRHKVDKDIYQVTLQDTSTVKVTEDHSLLKWDNGKLMEVAPTQINETDSMLVHTGDMESVWKGENPVADSLDVSTVESVEKVDTDSEYVYDLDVMTNNTFMANGIFVHNTDSIFVELDGFEWDEQQRETIYESYRIGEYVNARMDDFAQNFCGIQDHMFEIEFEKYYPKLFIGDGAKRYAGRRAYNV